MTGSVISKAWNGAPKQGDTAYLFSGSVSYNGDLPAGSLTIWSQSKVPTSMALYYSSYYGTLTSNFALRTMDTSGAGVDLSIRNAVPAGTAHVFSYIVNGTIDDLGGTLRVSMQGSLTNNGAMHAHSGSEFDVTTSVNGFTNNGTVGAVSDGAGWSNFKITTGANGGFTNFGVLEAKGNNTQVGVATTVSDLSHGGALANYGVIRSSVGGAIFLDAPVVGNGQMQTNGGLIKISKPVSSGETVDITKGTLEFGSPSNIFGTPAMQFLGSISNFTAASTILIDSAFGTNLNVTTTFNRAGLATSELKVYDTRPSVAHPGGVTIGDFKLAGIPQGTFQVTGNHQAGGAFNDYTAITFRPTVIAYR